MMIVNKIKIFQKGRSEKELLIIILVYDGHVKIDKKHNNNIPERT